MQLIVRTERQPLYNASVQMFCSEAPVTELLAES